MTEFGYQIAGVSQDSALTGDAVSSFERASSASIAEFRDYSERDERDGGSVWIVGLSETAAAVVALWDAVTDLLSSNLGAPDAETIAPDPLRARLEDVRLSLADDFPEWEPQYV